MHTNFDVILKTVVHEEVPNLGSVITLDNKGRLINSQFSKPSSSQNLLKLNHSDELPDADDLPYAVISYGDTPNLINLPYNDHNYVSPHSSKKVENYDKKALEYMSKQSSQSSSRSSFNTTGSVRISHFSSYNSSTSQNDSFLFNDKYKPQHQFTFNQQVSHTSTPLVTNKTMPIINHNNNNNNNTYPKNNYIPGTIVINSGSVNQLKGVNVIQLRRPSLDSAKLGETRIINLPMKKPSVLTNNMGNNQVNGDRDLTVDKSNMNKSISLVPRCICRFTHDDGGMIRCEICQTWQHIVCMYPDNKFPIYYKCECCEPRDIDVKRAVATQTNILIKSGNNPADFLVRQEFNDFDLDNDSENNFVKNNVSRQFVIVKPEIKTYRSVNDTIPTTTIPIYITASKDGPIVPPGSPRTSKRKQDLISCKSVLTKPNVIVPKLSVNNIIVNNKLEVYNPCNTGTDTPYNYPILPTSTYKTQSDMIQYVTSPSYTINPTSARLKAILSTKVQFHTNLSVYNLHYLKQNNFIINTNMYDVVVLDFSRYAVKAVVEFNSTEIVMEYNGNVSLAEEYNKECDFRKHYNPFVLFYDKCDRLSMAVDSSIVDNKARYVRRSCTPNAEVKHRLLQDGQIRFYIVPINKIHKHTEITIPFDYNFMKCRYDVECACNQPSCQLIFLRMGTESQKSTEDFVYERNVNMYDCVNAGLENVRTGVNMTRPYKKRGRGSKILSSVGRPLSLSPDNTVILNDIPRTSPIKIVRRNKRGRPPLNRATGIHRADIIPSNILNSDTSFNHVRLSPKHLQNDLSDHDPSIQGPFNEKDRPHMAIYTNFKNFKRIPSSHWSLKTTRKISSISKKPIKKLSITPKVGRPFKIKPQEPIVSEHEEEEYPSDHSQSSEDIKPSKLSFSEEGNNNSNDDNDGSCSAHSNRDDLSREDEGKYWLEEINNKILKQKVKEAKKVQRKSKLRKRKSIECKTKVEPEKLPEHSPIKEVKETKETKETKEITVHVEPSVEVVTEMLTPKKPKRLRKGQKQNANYILSYKPSNIDDLKNDLMLITASLEEDKEDEHVAVEDVIKEEDTIKKSVEYVEDAVEYVEEVVEHVEESIDHSQVSVEHVQEYMEQVEESVEHVEESVEHVEEFLEPSELSMDKVEVSLERIDEALPETVQKVAQKHVSESGPDDKVNDTIEDGLQSPKIKKVNKSNKADKDRSSKASREERWVNTMWQRILKNEHHFDNKTKRRRSKSSAAEGSIASEENRNDTSEIGSPKMGYSELSEDRDSSSNSKSSSAQKLNRKTKPITIECDSRPDDRYLSVKLVDCDVKTENKWNYTMSATSSNSADDHQLNEHKEVSSEQCGLIVYKEQHSNPMEKFSRENSAKLFTSNNVCGPAITNVFSNVIPPPHTKKRWLSQALMEETFNEETPSPKIELDVEGKLSSIDIVSKRSFLPPVFTSSDNVDLSSSNSQKVAINPKKRLLNQFSMEDNALRTDFDNSPSKIMSSPIPFKLSKSETNVDQEQSKTKLTLSEYRKRRFVDNSPKDFTNSLTKYQKSSTEFNNAWRALDEATLKNENITNDEFELEKSIVDKVDVCDKEVVEQSHITTLSYLDTLNNLPIPTVINPRLSSGISTSPVNVLQDLSVINYDDFHDIEDNEAFEPKSPSDSPNSFIDYHQYRGGPRTPSESGDLINNVPTPVGSIRSFASHPSPTSDCHFDFEKDTSSFLDNDKSTSVSEPWTTDWTSHTTTIGKMAGIKNPDLLQEIEEFEDEYVPMPENLPERSKEELETLVLTQKRDSQIREWQEVKQLEREKVKLDHQVRSMARRLNRVNKKMNSTSEVMEKTSMKNTCLNYDVNEDEKTMKTFNIQLVNINGKLMEQISMLKSDSEGGKNCRLLRQDHANLPHSYKYIGENNADSDNICKYSRRRKKTAVSTDNRNIYNNQLENPTFPQKKISNETVLLTLSSNQTPTHMTISNQKSADTIVSKYKTTQMISSNQIVLNSSNQNQSLIISNQIEKIVTMNSAASGTNIHGSLPSLLPPEIRSNLV